MAYIGRNISSLSDRVVLDNITASATATYNLLLNSVAYVPSSAESLTVSLNGVIQKPQSSYTVSGSTIVFDSALTSSDSIDFILAERAITLTTVGSGSVGTSQLVDGAVTYAKTDGSFGKIGQVVSTLTNDNLTTNSTSYSSIMSLSITPTSTSSKILIHHTAVSDVVLSNTSNVGHIALFRDSTNITTAGHNSSYHSYTGRSRASGSAIMHLDSPSSTSAISYSVRGKVDNTGLTMNYGTSTQQRCVSLTLMEVLA